MSECPGTFARCFGNLSCLLVTLASALGFELRFRGDVAVGIGLSFGLFQLFGEIRNFAAQERQSDVRRRFVRHRRN